MEETIINVKVVDNINDATKKTNDLDQSLTNVEKSSTRVRTGLNSVGTQGGKSMEGAAKGTSKLELGLKGTISGIQFGLQGFQALQGATAIFGSKSEDLQKTLVKVQSAMAMAQGVQGMVRAGKEFGTMGKTAIKSLQGIKGAVAATGIGLLVIAVGLLVAYWDDIKGLVSGVTSEQEKLNKASAKNLEMQEKKLDTVSSQDNILKLQGKSEKDILRIKMKQTDEVIAAMEVSIANAKATKKAQVDAATRNRDITQGIIAFLMAPLTLLLGLIDAITYGLSQVGIGSATNYAQDATEGMANMFFDPEEVAEEADKTIEEQEKGLLTMKNNRAGYELGIQDIDKKGKTSAKTSATKHNVEMISIERELFDLRNELIKDQYQKEKEALDEKYRREIEDVLKNEKYSAGQKSQLKNQLEINHLAAMEKLEVDHNARREAERQEHFDKLIILEEDQIQRELDINDEKYRRLNKQMLADTTLSNTEKEALTKYFGEQKILGQELIYQASRKQQHEHNAKSLTQQEEHLLLIHDREELNLLQNLHLEDELNALRLKKRNEEHLAELEDLNLTAEQKKLIIAKYNDDILGMQQAHEESKDEIVAQSNANIQQKIADVIDMTMQGFQSMSDIVAMMSEKQTKDINKRYDAEIKKANGNVAMINKLEARRVKELNKQAKKVFQIQKAADLAQAITSGYLAVQSTFAQTKGGLIQKGVAAGLAGIASAITIAKIASSKYEEQTFKPAEIPQEVTSPTETNSQVVAPQFNLSGNSNVNQLGNLNGVLQAFVVSGNVTSAQALDRNKIQNATL